MADTSNIRWISDAEKVWLYNQAEHRKLIVEVGSHLGWSTVALASGAPSGKVIAVDDWKGPRDVPGLYGRDYFAEFCENIKAAGIDDRVEPLRMDHAEFADKVRQELYADADMVFIDGSHEYPDVRRDIEAWLHVPGKRLICGHDRNWPGVNRAVNELLPDAYDIPGTALWAWGESVIKPRANAGLPSAQVGPPPTNSDPVAAMCNTKKLGGLCLGVPSSGRTIQPQVAIAWHLLQWPIGMNKAVNFQIGRQRDNARVELAKGALERDCSYLAMLDDDVEPPIDFLIRLVSLLKQHEPDGYRVVAGIYTDRSRHPQPLVYRGHNGPFWHWKAGETFEVDVAATGCMVINTDVFRHISEPWFRDVEEYHKPGGSTWGAFLTDDAYFCHKVRAAGFRILADGATLCRHWDPETGTSYQLAPDSYPMRGRSDGELKDENERLRKLAQRIAAAEDGKEIWDAVQRQAAELVGTEGFAGTGGVDQPIPLVKGRPA